MTHNFQAWVYFKVSVDVCTAPSLLNVRWADSHLATLRNGNSALPLQNPMGLEKKENVSSFLRFQGTEKNIFNEGLCCFSKQEKKLQILLPDAFWNRLGKRITERKTHTKPLNYILNTLRPWRHVFLRHLLAGYHKVNRCYLDKLNHCT